MKTAGNDKKIPLEIIEDHTQNTMSVCYQGNILRNVPPWAKYITIDIDGDLSAHQIQPTKHANAYWQCTGKSEVLFTVKGDFDWENSLEVITD